MKTRSIVRVAIGIAFGISLSSPALAQSTKPDNAVVWVVTTDGQERKGRLLLFTPDRLVMKMNGEERTINVADLLRVDTTDSISNGIRNGAITGGIFGGLGFLALATCKGCGSGAVAAGAFFAGFYTLAGAGLGALIDHAIEDRRPLYSRPSSPRVSFQPLVAPRHGGMRIAIQW